MSNFKYTSTPCGKSGDWIKQYFVYAVNPPMTGHIDSIGIPDWESFATGPPDDGYRGINRKEVINMGNQDTGPTPGQHFRRDTIADELQRRIDVNQEANINLKDMQELQGLLERNKSVARILELQRKLGL